MRDFSDWVANIGESCGDKRLESEIVSFEGEMYGGS